VKGFKKLYAGKTGIRRVVARFGKSDVRCRGEKLFGGGGGRGSGREGRYQ